MSRDQSSTPSRRAMLGGTLAALAAAPALVAVPVPASAAEPDADLYELGRKYLLAYAKREAFYSEVVEPAESRFKLMIKDLPDEILVGPNDLCLLGVPNLHTGRAWVATSDGAGKWVQAFSSENIEYLRTTPRTRQDHTNMTKRSINGKEYFVPGVKADVKAQARADEIVAEYDRQDTEKRLARETSGLAKADAEYETLLKTTEELLLSVLQYPAHTYRGVIIQAHCAEQDISACGGFDRQFASEMEEEGSSGLVSSRAAAFAIARNLSRLAKRGALS